MRAERLMQRRVKAAAFREPKTLEDFDWQFNTSVKRKQIYDMALQLAGGDEEQVKTFIRQESSFTVKDKNGNDQQKFAETVEQITTEKWINMTHKRMKETFKKAYPQEPLPFEEKEKKK